MNSTHHYEQLIEIFNSCFADEFNTRLIKGDDEPIYLQQIHVGEIGRASCRERV